MARQRRQAQGTSPDPTSILPEAFKACQGWQIDEQQPIQLLSEEEFQDEYISDALQENYINMADKMEAALRLNGRVANSFVEAYNLLLSNRVMNDVVEYTNQALAAEKACLTDVREYRRFLAHRNIVSRINMSIESAFRHFIPLLASHHGFTGMNVERFKELLNCSRAFSLEGRSGANDEAWWQRSTYLRKISTLEKAMFAKSLQLCLNKKNGVVVVDDELIASRAKDVELKTVSNRKSGKDGPVSDCIADSLTGLLFGMRLRIRGETQFQNVSALLDTMPEITSIDHQVRMTFDRGYGKLPFVQSVSSKNYNVTTIANDHGSRHPSITDEEVQKLKQAWERKQPPIPQGLQDAAENIFRDFVFETADLLGPESKTAWKDVDVGDGKVKRILATVQRETYDKKVSSKVLRFFSVGAMGDALKHTWVGQPSNKVRVSASTLFGKLRNIDKGNVEEKLLEKCRPLTLTQRTADWFCQKANRLTGTMAGKLVSATDDDGILDERAKTTFLDSCIDSWFARHPSTEAMRVGSLNEIPTMEALSCMGWIHAIYECGLLEWKEAPYIGVSPDGIAYISVPDRPNEKVLACIEIKTRSSPDTIAKAQESATKHGKLVHCTYNDDVFKDCVWYENRTQILHQAVVTGLDYAVFVVSKVEHQEGCIVQIVVAKLEEPAKRVHADQLLSLGNDILGWLFLNENVNAGKIARSTIPSWVSQSQTKILDSQYGLWVAQYKSVKNDNATYKPTEPLTAYKHSTQYAYNKGKWGLDKNTELTKRISLDCKLSFEGKYLFRLIDGITLNHWRWEQGRTLVKPFVANYFERHGRNPSATQLRKEASKLSIDDHVFNLGIECLKHIALEEHIEQEQRQLASRQSGQYSFMPVVFQGDVGATGADLINTQERAITRFISQQRAAGKFPVQRNRAKTFANTAQLDNLRRHHSPRFRHTSSTEVEKTGKDTRATCALCRAKTSHYCSLCRVSLCHKRHDGIDHHQMWHDTEDLIQLYREEELKERQREKRTRTQPGHVEENSEQDNNNDNERHDDNEEVATMEAATTAAVPPEARRRPRTIEEPTRRSRRRHEL